MTTEMSDAAEPISSAVILPEDDASNSPRSKRRRSSTADSTSKRPRFLHDRNDGSPSALRESPSPTEAAKDLPQEKATNPHDERRKSSVQEEKKRGQRLFGGLLSTLSQSTPNGQQKRRLEIEKRQQEKAKLQKAADEVQRTERLAKLKAIRKVEQVKFDEQSMRIQHSNMLAMAHFLCTKTDPKLYYKPWELLPKDEDRIKKQIADAESQIEKEIEEFEARHPKNPYERQLPDESTNSTSKETVGEPQTESPSVSNIVDTTNDPVQVPQSDAKTEKNANEEHIGEVVENEEDTVIY